MVMVEGLGPHCSDPFCVFRFISPDLFFLSTLFKKRICAVTDMLLKLLKVAFTIIPSCLNFHLRDLAQKMCPPFFREKNSELENTTLELKNGFFHHTLSTLLILYYAKWDNVIVCYSQIDLANL